MSLHAVRCCLAALLAASVAGSPLVSAAVPTAGDASLRGRIVISTGATAPAGVVVALVDPTSADQMIYRSAPTDDRGAFHLDAVPAGAYRLLVETSEGAFLASEPVTLKTGTNPPVALTLKSASPAEGGGGGGGGGGSWQKWVIIGAIVIGAFFVVDALTEEESASAF